MLDTFLNAPSKFSLKRFRGLGAAPLMALILTSSGCDSNRAATSEQSATTENTLPVTATTSEAPADTAGTMPTTPAINTVATAEAAGSAPAADTAASTVAEPEPVKDSKWPVKGPEPLAGAILPNTRIVAYYGNQLSKRMGILGELPPDQMLARLDEEVAAWAKADPNTPVKPALHLVAVTAQGAPGAAGKYRMRMTDKVIDQVIEWAQRRDALVFLDIQVGQGSLEEEIPALEKYLKMPQVHLGVDPEFAMQGKTIPGKKVGTFDAKDLNYATGYLAKLVRDNNIPPKVFVVHRFTQRMVTNYQDIKLRPEVQVVMHMDGWGPPELKKGTYRHFIHKEPVQYTGFKLFYHNDTKKGHPLMKPEQILKLNPQPIYIQYQ